MELYNFSKIKESIPIHNKLEKQKLPIDDRLRSTSEPKKTMIMPREFNSTSDPQVSSRKYYSQI